MHEDISLRRLIQAVSDIPFEPTAEDIADILWLASHSIGMTETGSERVGSVERGLGEPGPSSGVPLDADARSAGLLRDEARELPTTPVPLYLQTGSVRRSALRDASSASMGSVVRVPDALALADPRGLARAMRPF